MNFKIHHSSNGNIAEFVSVEKLGSLDDFLDLMGNANYQNVYKIIIKEKHLPRGFLDLKTGIAGEILQKFSTYNQQLAIVGDFSLYKSKSLKDFIRESNRIGRIIFTGSIEDAIKRL